MEYFNKLLLQSCIFRMVLILFWAIIFIVWGLYHSSFSTMTNKREIYSKSYASHFSLPFQTFIQHGPQFSEEKKQVVYNSDAAEYEGKWLAKMNIGKDKKFSPTENVESLEREHSAIIGDEKHPFKFPEYSEGDNNKESALNEQPTSSEKTSFFKNLTNATHMPKETLLYNSEVSELGTETLSPSEGAYNSKLEMPTLLKIEVVIKDKIKHLFSKMKHLWFKKTQEEK